MDIAGRTVVVAGLLAVAVGCGGQPRVAEPSADDAVPPLEDVGPCDDNSACAEGFLVEGRFYGLSCGAVRSDLVSDEVLAAGRWAGEHRELRRIDGVDPDVLVAIDVAAGPCNEGDDVLSPWSMVFPPGASQEATRAAACTAAVREQRERDGC